MARDSSGFDVEIPEDLDARATRYDELEAFQYMLNRPPLLDQEEFAGLYRRWKNGDSQAREEIVSRNSRLVLSVVTRRTGRSVPLPDLMQVGLIGLVKALDRFDPEAGCKFSTYAVWWIKQAVSRERQDHDVSRPFRLPVHVHAKLGVVTRSLREFFFAHRRWPTSEELFSWVHRFDGTPEGTVVARNITQPDVQLCQDLIAQTYFSLDALVRGDEEDGPRYGDLVGDIGAQEPTVEQSDTAKEVAKMLEGLPSREAEILRLRLYEGFTQDQAGHRFGIGRERTRQLEKRALGRLANRFGRDRGDVSSLAKAGLRSGKNQSR